MATTSNLSAVVIGATGAVGQSLVNQLLTNPQFSKVTTVGRRKLDSLQNVDTSKLNEVVVDMENMKSVKDEIGNNDVAFSCLGTTKAAAGSAEAFRHIDYDLNVEFANICKEKDIKCFNLVSSQMANANSWFFYMKTKGQAEEKIKEIGFPILNIFRPGLLDRKDKTRMGEKIAKCFVSSISVDTVAKAMINFSISQLNKADAAPVSVVDNAQIKQLASD
ncbi:putative transcription coactivator-like protein [Leptotrombidium deliense]|uniref:Protein HTATIP2 n=1 Tax=Leptotrombidium deliense TaxID=299467 RepID=A0A443SD36_9ACAR|nr:putative transcription coactivator-like protein [Leptotrombidium deliense]